MKITDKMISAVFAELGKRSRGKTSAAKKAASQANGAKFTGDPSHGGRPIKGVPAKVAAEIRKKYPGVENHYRRTKLFARYRAGEKILLTKI